MDFVDNKTPELLPSYTQEGPSRDLARSQRRRKVFRKITLIFTSVLLFHVLFKNAPFLEDQYASFSRSLSMQSWDWPIPSDLHIVDCPDVVASMSEIGETSVHLDLPLSSEGLFLISRGSYSFGNVFFSQSDEVSDTIEVDVDIQYMKDHDDLDLVKVCSVTRGDSQNGIGIFTPHHIDRRHVHLRFDVHVTLPQSDDSGSPLNIPYLDLDMPVFSQHFSDLSSVFFDNLVVRTSVASVTAQNIVSRHAKLNNSNGAIKGHFNSSDYLEITTSNGAIDVSVDLNSLDSAKATILKLHTSNAHIKSAVSLISANTTGGNFDVSTHTSVGAVELDFPSAPVDSNLTVHASTSVGSAHVGLHETYEGSFRLSTSLGQTVLDYDHETEKKRGRNVVVERVSGGGIHGAVFKSEEGRNRGKVDVSTSLARVELVL